MVAILVVIVLVHLLYTKDVIYGDEDGSDDTPSRKSCYNFRVTEINRVVDGDTIDVIDLGFDLYKKKS